ncbi:MAG: DEAD/DEAH box helicase [Cytophagaceae bacterium]
MTKLNFEDLKLNRQLLNAIEECGYTQPTEIQYKSIPQVLAGHDVIGIAQTGTGKTAAYVLPILRKLNYAQGQMPRAIILGPTRELVLQIEEVFKQMAKYTDLRIVALYGGIGPKTQIELVEAGCDIIISTPGRFTELYSKEILLVKEIKTMVLDEADKMMDMGFMPQLRKILDVIPRKRQNLLFTATLSERVEKLTEEFLDFPMKIEVTPQATPATTVEQVKYETPNLQTKLNLLSHFLDQEEEFNRVILFVRTRKNADIVEHLIQKAYGRNSCRSIHANKGQNSRLNAVAQFKDGEARILVATDVAARGIDIEKVSHVINFDVPLVYDDYVHRIGRTGRAFQNGVAISMVTPADVFHMEKIEKLIKMKIPTPILPQEVDIPPTPYEEQQEMNRQIDHLKKLADPTYKGAFHDKVIPKKKPAFKKNTKKRR